MNLGEVLFGSSVNHYGILRWNSGGHRSKEDQNEQRNKSGQRHKVPILKHLCLSLLLLMAMSGGLLVSVKLNHEFSARPPRKEENTVGFLKCEYCIFLKAHLRF